MKKLTMGLGDKAEVTIDIGNLGKDSNRAPRLYVSVAFRRGDSGLGVGVPTDEQIISKITSVTGATYDKDSSRSGPIDSDRMFAFIPRFDGATYTLDAALSAMKELGFAEEKMDVAEKNRMTKAELRSVLSSDGVVDALLAAINGRQNQR